MTETRPRHALTTRVLTGALALAAPLALVASPASAANPPAAGSESDYVVAKAPVLVPKPPEPTWVLPVENYEITGTFGATSSLWSSSHTGLDFAADEGTPIRAVTGGVVESVGYDGAYGNKTVIRLDDGTRVWYCHQSETDVSTGEEVEAGQTIGAVGSTGNVTGPHLHLEFQVGDEPQDPAAVLSEHGLEP